MSASLVSPRPAGIRSLLLAAVVVLTHALPAQSYWITGYIRTPYGWPFPNVSVIASNGGGSATTGSNGNYKLFVPNGWTGTVRASRGGYGFSPAYAKFSSPVWSDVTVNFTATWSVKTTFTISGFVRTATGAGVSEVTITASDGTTVTTDLDGYYNWKGPIDWPVTLTPSKSGWSFTPPSRACEEPWDDHGNQDYTAETQSRTVSGHFRTSAGVAIPGVTVSAGKDGGSATTGAAGSYSLTLPDGWSGTVTPSKPGYTFVPPSRTYSEMASDHGSEDYTASAPSWTLSGDVRDSDGAGIPGVTISASNGGGTVTSDSSGRYRLTLLHGWVGHVVPSKVGYLFSPPARGYGDLSSHQSDQDYAGNPVAVIYVDAAAAGRGDGTSWGNACRFLQDALRAAVAGNEIRVAKGLYTPDRGPGRTPGDRKASFRLGEGVILKGGYAGAGRPNPQTRNFSLYQTVLSGDLHGDDSGDWSDPSRSENSYNVVTVEAGLATTLDGVTITGGNADALASAAYSTGGGLAATAAHLILTHCTFRGNSAIGAGGGLVSRGGRLTLTDCSFVGNSGARGGGLCAGYGDRPTDVTLVNCTFLANSAATTGAALEIARGSGTLTNCTFHGNTTASGASVAGVVTTITNCILWDSKPLALTGGGGTIRYSNVQGGTGRPWFGTGCLDADPLFADLDGQLSSSSPCLDAGNNAAVPSDLKTDLAGQPRIQQAVVDMGAYEKAVGPEELLHRTVALVQELPAAGFTPLGSRQALVSQLQATIAFLQAGLNRDALNTLRSEILPAMDGCSQSGQPDDTDWIATCEVQQKLFPLVTEAVEALARHTLTVTATPGGSVTKPGEGAFVYTDGDSVSLEAVAESGYRFARWSGTAVEAGKVVIPSFRRAKLLLDADYTVSANFERVEDFESGQLSDAWSTSSLPWHVTSENAHSMPYSVRGAVLPSGGGRTTLTLYGEVTDGEITFWRRVGIDDGTALYRFRIDGKLQEELSKGKAWTQVSFPVTAGSHTFEWEYWREATYARTPDTVYLDDISLPPAP